MSAYALAVLNLVTLHISFVLFTLDTLLPDDYCGAYTSVRVQVTEETYLNPIRTPRQEGSVIGTRILRNLRFQTSTYLDNNSFVKRFKQ